MKSNISKVNRLDPVVMDSLFNFLKADCYVAYKHLDRQTFDDCEIYIFTDSRDPIKNIKGIIGIRRTIVQDLNINNLEYYCQSHGVIYSIEFMHVFDIHNTSYKVNMVTEMINVALVDKNDTFTIFIPKCPISTSDYVYKSLIGINFKMYPYLKNKSSIVVFIRAPKVA